MDPKSREVIRNACKAVGSISDTSFDIRFNPDIFSPGTCAQSWDQPAADKNCSVAKSVAGCCFAGHGAGLCEAQGGRREEAAMGCSAGAAKCRRERLLPRAQGCAKNPPVISSIPAVRPREKKQREEKSKI